MNENSNDARERVARARTDASLKKVISDPPTFERTKEQLWEHALCESDAAIAAYNSWLWPRADDPAVVDAYTKALTDEIEERHHPRWVYDVAVGVVEAAMEQIIGPRPEQEVE